MKIKELQMQLDRLVKADPTAADADVVFGPEGGEHVFLRGGIFGRSKTGGAGRLILAEIKLDAVGGF
jgi:hypothetical protein